jgi:hypothetical protein
MAEHIPTNTLAVSKPKADEEAKILGAFATISAEQGD